MIYQPVPPYLANNVYYQSPYQQRLTTIEQTQSNIPMAASGAPQPTNFLRGRPVTYTYRYMDRENGQMYYTDRMRRYQDGYSYGIEHHEPYTESTVYERDPREGRSALRRKMYMESKENKKSKDQQMKELEAYMQELSTDVTEMIKDASPEEKAILRQKMTTLASKIA